MESTPPGPSSPNISRMNTDTPADQRQGPDESESEYFSAYENQPDSDKDLEHRSTNSPPTPKRVKPVPTAAAAAVQSDPPTPTRDAGVQTTLTQSLPLTLDSLLPRPGQSGLDVTSIPDEIEVRKQAHAGTESGTPPRTPADPESPESVHNSGHGGSYDGDELWPGTLQAI